METVRVRVTQENIDKGQAMSTRNCPVARALKNLGMKYCTVNDVWIWKDNRPRGNDYMLGGPTPKKAQDFIHKFDRGDEVEPISFDLIFE